MNYRVTSRPARPLWLTAQFRLYDYDNRTPHFPVSQYVRVDSGVGRSLTGGSEPFGYTRHFVDLDALVHAAAVYRRSALATAGSRTTARFDSSKSRPTHGSRPSVDSVGLAWGSLRAAVRPLRPNRRRPR